jgi:hypothetical protein
VLYYHIYKLKLAKSPESWNETKTHISRSFTLGLIVLILTFFRPHGIWFWVVGSLFIIDFINNGLDAYLEFKSRIPENGLPQFEYMIHLTGATWMGAVSLSFFILNWKLQFLPSGLVDVGDSIPQMLKMNMYLTILGSFSLASYELVTMLLSMKKY